MDRDRYMSPMEAVRESGVIDGVMTRTPSSRCSPRPTASSRARRTSMPPRTRAASLCRKSLTPRSSQASPSESLQYSTASVLLGTLSTMRGG